MRLPLRAAAPRLAGGRAASGAAAAGVAGTTALIGAASLGITAGSAVVGAAGAQESAQASAHAANYQAQVAANNATAARQQGNANAETAYRQGDMRLGMQRAAFGAMGVDANSGSARQTQDATALDTGMNVANTRYDASLNSIGFRQSAVLGAARAQQDLQAGQWGMGTSLLSGASQFSSRWANFSANGVFGGAPPPVAAP